MIEEDFSDNLKRIRYEREGLPYEFEAFDELTPKQAKENHQIKINCKSLYLFKFNTPFKQGYTCFVKSSVGSKEDVAERAHEAVTQAIKDRLMKLYKSHRNHKNKDNPFIGENNRDEDPLS